MKLDILAFGAHPDDVELSCSGTLLHHIGLGKKVGVVDLTKGELGTRGSAEIRSEEAKKAAELMGISARENLELPDGFLLNDQPSQLKVVQVIRRYQPDIVLATATEDRHPDHGKAAKIVADSCFLSGLVKIETEDASKKQEAWRPKAVYHYVQDYYLEPDLVVDITPYLEKKMEIIKAYASQFGEQGSKTMISSPEFLEYIKLRAIQFGRPIGVKYGEGFVANRYVGVKNLFDLL